jgi:hypothetical protein
MGELDGSTTPRSHQEMATKSPAKRTDEEAAATKER